MIQYEKIIYKKMSLVDHFEDITNFFLKEFKKVRKKSKDVGKYYHIALIPPRISEYIEAAIEKDPREILLLEELIEEKKEIYCKFMIPAYEAINVVEKRKDIIGCIHSDLITPYKPFEAGNKIYEGKSVLEINFFKNFDIIPHFSERKDLYLMKRLRERYSL
jgi:hypothetical protein